MPAFLLGRFVSLALSLLAASVVIFFVLEVVPGDPAQFMLGLNATPELANALREQLGLTGPLHERYFTWLFGLLRGDLGISYGYKVPVADLVADRIWISLPLAIYALVLSTLIAFPVGILAATKRNSPTDVSIMGLTQLGVANPELLVRHAAGAAVCHHAALVLGRAALPAGRTLSPPSVR
jgi:peptide/nickel transport system permease protein